ncbi:DUF6377 domain-containing protein [Pedobacter aquatilis]|uniref:DUF6377 domain-containing protein n=1 Tax=Pedobacter aquatilis TaxID=351343 RepID=UPI0025B35E6E|nr:DUF6377 domain-containing protein [Pedobacter aquatilis]MDN3588471.1 DUF6377 domain-containing protein [Pedobacter aquatilis]
MKFLLLTILSFLLFTSSRSAQRDSLLKVLKSEISNKDKYEQAKLTRIERMKANLKSNHGSSFGNLLKLFEEYEYYQFDSAYRYGVKLLEVSTAMQDREKISISKVKISSLLLHAGMFKETFDLLIEINPSLLNSSYRYDYYCLKSGAYSNLAIYNGNSNFTDKYNRRAVSYLDSALTLCSPNSFEELFTKGNRQVVAGETNKEPVYFLSLLKNYTLTKHQRARVLTGLAAFYQTENENDTRVSLLIESAIFDIRSSVRETLATLLLAEDLFSHGHLEDAYTFIQHSRTDAEFYGNKLRKLKIESVYPEIASQVNIVAQKDKNRLMIYFLSISSLSILILLVSFIIFIQLKKVRAKERIIEQKNIELESFNTQLVHINDKLREYAMVNEKYIGYFFEMVSAYILKLDRLKRSVERKMLAKRYNEVLPTLNSIDIKTERALLYNTFDRVFVSIFPNFIQAFNDLLKQEDQIFPKAPEVLNVDLRIFALIRLGINDVRAIAAILEYSENTIYVYKMRIKAKSLVSSEEFDKSIMSVKAV